jgi:hypothetical protein
MVEKGCGARRVQWEDEEHSFQERNIQELIIEDMQIHIS